MLELEFKEFPILETERLILRELTKNDVQDLFNLRSNPKVMHYIDRPLADSLDVINELIDKIAANYNANDGILWVISLKEDPKLLGTIGFWRLIKEHYRAEIGYILDPEQWGKGIMNEAMRAVLKYGFKDMNLHSVEAVVNPENEASISVLERNNFKREAYYRENYYYQGKFLDSGVYSLIIGEWGK